MISTVRDDTRNGARGTGHKSRLSCRCAALRTGLIAGALLWPMVAPCGSFRPDAALQAAELGLKFREAQATDQRLIIPLSRSVVVEATAPASRVQAVESNIARVESISPTQFLVTGVGYGVTQVLIWDADGRQQLLEVHVELDLDRLNEMLHQIDPLSDTQAISVKGHILLTGTVTSVDTAEKMVRVAGLFAPPTAANVAPESLVQNHLRVSGEQQVLLRCVVAEISRNALRELGVNGFLAGDDFRDAFVVNQLGGINPINLGAAADVNVQSTIPFLTGADGIPLSSSVPLSLGFPRVQMQLFIQAMAQNSLLKVLAEPDLVAISGETASFLAGGEFPIPVPQSGAATGAVTIEFREFGVRVNFTPVVLGQQRIRLRVAPEVSETDYSNALQIQGFVVPGLTQRRVETTVEVGSGQTLAVAGLLSEEVRGIASRIPALGDVPVLGALFRSVEYRRRQSELVIMVTPEIIAPLDPQQVGKYPGADLSVPSDIELYALGLLEGSTGGGAEPCEESGGYRTGLAPSVTPLRSQPDELSVHGPWGYSTAEDAP